MKCKYKEVALSLFYNATNYFILNNQLEIIDSKQTKTNNNNNKNKNKTTK